MDTNSIRARRAAGETLHEIARDLGVSHVEVARMEWGGRQRTRPTDNDNSYVVEKVQIGKCSTDYSLNPISLARSAT